MVTPHSPGWSGRADAPRPRGHSLLPLPFQFRDELLDVFPLAQRSKVGVLLHVRHVLAALAHSIAEELHRRVAGPGVTGSGRAARRPNPEVRRLSQERRRAVNFATSSGAPGPPWP